MIPKSVRPGEIINEGELPEIDDRKRAAGAWSKDLISGQPVGWFITKLFQRAAVPEDSDLWKSTEWVHPSHQGECERLPDPFPQDDWESLVTDLQTVGDWLTLLSKTQITLRIAGTPAAPAAPEPSPYNPDNAVSIFTDTASHSGVRPAAPPAAETPDESVDAEPVAADAQPAPVDADEPAPAIALPGETETPPAE
jgi:hypothetical protein